MFTVVLLRRCPEFAEEKGSPSEDNRTWQAWASLHPKLKALAMFLQLRISGDLRAL